MATLHQFLRSGGSERNTIFVILDFFGDTYDHFQSI
jgi:hypothetical protein